MNKSPPVVPGARPAWGCLDGEEIQLAATGQADDPGIHEHLARCEDCRRAVHELRREVRRPGGHSEVRRGPARRPRRMLWLVLLALVIGAVAWVVTRKTDQPAPVTSEPVAAPAEAPPVRRTRPRARRAGPSIDGEIVATIRRNQGGVRICYERALKRDEGLVLRLDVHLRIRSTGDVDLVSFDGPLPPELAACMRNVIKTWKFPGAPEAYRSTFPLRLQPGR